MGGLGAAAVAATATKKVTFAPGIKQVTKKEKESKVALLEDRVTESTDPDYLLSVAALFLGYQGKDADSLGPLAGKDAADTLRPLVLCMLDSHKDQMQGMFERSKLDWNLERVRGERNGLRKALAKMRKNFVAAVRKKGPSSSSS